ncbi:MAG TPA: DUF2206 domain-containing protein [Gallicola sp.]|jgi:uncharacterized membrane protein|nr:DUF2206 domain-containing protein [Gallicola sp.]
MKINKNLTITERGYILILFVYLLLVINLSIYGAYFTNNGHSNVLSLAFIFLTSILPFIISKDVFLNDKILSITLYIIALSLLYHISLVGPYLNGSDIHTEYFYSNNVLINHYWDIEEFTNVNSMINMVIFLPILSLILNVDLISVFKIILPLIFSAVPVILFYIYKEKYSLEFSYLASILFMFIPIFYYNMPSHGRVQIAELFFVLSLFLIVHFESRSMKNRFILLIFTFCIVVSHYGLSYLYLFVLGLMSILLYFLKRKNVPTNFTSTYIIVFSVFLLSWYLYTSNGSLFSCIVRISDSIYTSVFNDFLQPDTRDTLMLATRNELSFVRVLVKWLQILVLASIVIGYLNVLQTKYTRYIVGHHDVQYAEDFFILTGFALFIVFLSVAIPTFSQRLNFWRLYQMMLIFLAPFGIFGMEWLLKKMNIKNVSILISMFLCVFLLFNMGFVSEILHDDAPINYALNKTTPSITYPRVYEDDLPGAFWLKKNTYNATYYGSADSGYLLLMSLFGFGYVGQFDSNSTNITSDSYILVTSNELTYNKLSLYVENEGVKSDVYYNSCFHNYLSQNKSKIYDSGASNSWR